MLTRFIYPLSLRERVSWKLYRFFPNVYDKNISLVFDKRIKLDLLKGDIGHKSIIFNGYTEADLTKLVIKLGSEGGFFIDVGANYGYFSCLWAMQNKSYKVVAFEASPLNLKPLLNNIEKNNLSEAITVVPLAIGKEKGKLKFNLGNESRQTGWGGLSINESTNSVTVDVDTLDNYAEYNQIKNINLLKIDTEGADTWVLYGAEKLLREHRIQHIFFEDNPERMHLLNIRDDEAKNFLEKLGYTVERYSSTDFYAYPAKKQVSLTNS